MTCAHFADSEDFYSDFELIYDLRKPGSENLDPRRLYDGPRSPDADFEGLLVYPKDWKLQPYRPAPSVNITYSFPSYFVWSSDSTKLLFMAEHAPAGTLPGDDQAAGGNLADTKELPTRAALQLVLVDVTTGRPVTRVLNVHECGTASGPTCGLVLTGAQFHPDGVTIGLGRNIPVAYRRTSKTFLFRDFRPL